MYIMAGMVVTVVLMGFYINHLNGRIDKKNIEIGQVRSELSTAQQINKDNVAEFKKIKLAQEEVQAIAEKSQAEANAYRKILNQSILEIANAKDNGPIPGVLQRTLDRVRARNAGS